MKNKLIKKVSLFFCSNRFTLFNQIIERKRCIGIDVIFYNANCQKNEIILFVQGIFTRRIQKTMLK